MQLKLYRWLTYIAGPFIDLYFFKRKRIGKEDPKRFQERLGHASIPRPAGSLVWFHAASVGESISILPLINKVTETYPDINILLTTGTVTSSQMLEGKLPTRAFHQYIPIDKIITVQRFLDHWKPDLALSVESELWPNLIIETHKTGCPMLQVNARISPDSFTKWNRYKSLARKMLACFELSLAQTEEDKERLETLGASNVKCIGNLKYDAPALPADPKETGRLVTMIGERPLWMAASTHAGEELLIAESHQKLKEAHAGLLTILAPRHPERCKEISKHIKDQFGLSTILRSSEEKIGEDTDIYIVDSIGELGIFYRLAGTVFMGGSLVEHGGQNPLEAARLECALITGPHTENFTKIYHELEEAEAVIRVHNINELAEKVDVMLTDYTLHEKLTATSLEIVESKAGVIDHYTQEITPYLQPLSKHSADTTSDS